MGILKRLGAVATLATTLLSMGCSSGSGTDVPADDGLAPPPAGEGVQYKMVIDLPAGQEFERCQFVLAPADGLNVVKQKIRYTAGSHHVLLFTTPLTEIPAKYGTEVFECDGFGDVTQVDSLLAGAQSA